MSLVNRRLPAGPRPPPPPAQRGSSLVEEGRAVLAGRLDQNVGAAGVVAQVGGDRVNLEGRGWGREARRARRRVRPSCVWHAVAAAAQPPPLPPIPQTHNHHTFPCSTIHASSSVLCSATSASVTSRRRPAPPARQCDGGQGHGVLLHRCDRCPWSCQVRSQTKQRTPVRSAPESDSLSHATWLKPFSSGTLLRRPSAATTCGAVAHHGLSAERMVCCHTRLLLQ